MDSTIDVLVNEPIGRISPNVYGHFAENLGGVIYDGVWVGTDSPIPNVAGIRKALIEGMRRIRAPIVRFPGGCFADSYDWRDGVGPVNRRPRRMNFWANLLPFGAPTNQRFDPNLFGTNEFIRFCRESGAEPYLAANVRSLSAQQFVEWVDYCNAPAGSTTLADARASDGARQPYNVAYWGIGNEAWGCGGSFTAEEYAGEFCRYSACVPDFGPHLSLVACGPDKDDWSWTRGFFEAIAKRGTAMFRTIAGFALHYYTWNLSRGRTTDFDLGKGDALNFNTVDWYELLRQGDRMQSLIDRHWQIMGEYDGYHRVKLAIDEWGSWYRPGSAPTPHNLFEQMPTMRDGVFSAMTLDTFNRNCDKVMMANCSQLINCLNSPFLAHEDRFCITPVGLVYELYAAHQGAQALRVEFCAPDVSYERDGERATLCGLSGSASIRDKTLIVTAVNPHVTERRGTTLNVHGAKARSAHLTTLYATDIHAHNTFEAPQAVSASAREIDMSRSQLVLELPPASISRLTVTI